MRLVVVVTLAVGLSFCSQKRQVTGVKRHTAGLKGECLPHPSHSAEGFGLYSPIQSPINPEALGMLTEEPEFTASISYNDYREALYLTAKCREPNKQREDWFNNTCDYVQFELCLLRDSSQCLTMNSSSSNHYVFLPPSWSGQELSLAARACVYDFRLKEGAAACGKKTTSRQKRLAIKIKTNTTMDGLVSNYQEILDTIGKEFDKLQSASDDTRACLVKHYGIKASDLDKDASISEAIVDDPNIDALSPLKNYWRISLDLRDQEQKWFAAFQNPSAIANYRSLVSELVKAARKEQAKQQHAYALALAEGASPCESPSVAQAKQPAETPPPDSTSTAESDDSSDDNEDIDAIFGDPGDDSSTFNTSDPDPKTDTEETDPDATPSAPAPQLIAPAPSMEACGKAINGCVAVYDSFLIYCKSESSDCYHLTTSVSEGRVCPDDQSNLKGCLEDSGGGISFYPSDASAAQALDCGIASFSSYGVQGFCAPIEGCTADYCVRAQSGILQKCNKDAIALQSSATPGPLPVGCHEESNATSTLKQLGVTMFCAKNLGCVYSDGDNGYACDQSGTVCKTITCSANNFGICPPGGGSPSGMGSSVTSSSQADTAEKDTVTPTVILASLVGVVSAMLYRRWTNRAYHKSRNELKKQSLEAMKKEIAKFEDVEEADTNINDDNENDSSNERSKGAIEERLNKYKEGGIEIDSVKLRRKLGGDYELRFKKTGAKKFTKKVFTAEELRKETGIKAEEKKSSKKGTVFAFLFGAGVTALISTAIQGGFSLADENLSGAKRCLGSFKKAFDDFDRLFMGPGGLNARNAKAIDALTSKLPIEAEAPLETP